MRATIVDLRYRMHEVLKALGRNEKISIFYHGKLKGILTPVTGALEKKVAEHEIVERENGVKENQRQREK